MNTVKMHQAIGNNPGKTINELSIIAGMPFNVARRAVEQLLKTQLVKPCQMVKIERNRYTYKLVD